MTYSPIVLFVYNRPAHTSQTIEALRQNQLAIQSDLIVFSDGPKTELDQKSVTEVRNYLKGISGFKSVAIFESEFNQGLAKSITLGVTFVLEKFSKVIVLEDDIVCSQYFLEYMNNALDLYENEPRVGCIHGWNYHLDSEDYYESTFFLPGADCWGWATWKSEWELFESDGSKLLGELKNRNLEFSFNRRNTMQYIQMLEDQIQGKNDSWAIRWHASLFLNEKFCLHPVNSLVKNIGMDGTGIHCDDIELPQKMGNKIELNKIEVFESEWFYHAFNAAQMKTQPLKKPIWRRFLRFLRS